MQHDPICSLGGNPVEKGDDVQLIREILIGQRRCIQHLGRKVPKEYSRPCMAKDQRFPLCGRDHARHLP